MPLRGWRKDEVKFYANGIYHPSVCWSVDFLRRTNSACGLRSYLGMPPFQKSAVFLNIVQKAFDPPPFYLNICPILQGVFFKRVFAGGVF